MNSKEFTRTFLDLEDDLNLFNRKAAGIYYWERIRHQAHQEILERKNITGKAQPEPNSNLLAQARKILKLAANLVFRNPFLAEPEREYLFWGKPRRKRIDSEWWDIFCDPIMNKFNEDNYTYLEPPYLGQHFKPTKTNEVYHLDALLYIPAIIYSLGFFKPKISEKKQSEIKKIESELNQRLQSEYELLEEVSRVLHLRKLRKPVYKILLKRLRPDILIITVGKGKETLIEVAKEHNIRVIELQHGAISNEHLAYSFSDGKHKKNFADYFFSFGEYWEKNVSLPVSNSHIKAVGYPFLDMQAKKFSDVEKEDKIIFISQGTVGEELSKFAVELSEEDDFNKNIIYKLHPGEYNSWKERYPWLEECDVTVIDNDEKSLYRLFAESKAQIGVYSTAIYEGLIFDLQTFIYDMDGSEHMENLLKHQGIKEVQHPEDIEITDTGLQVDRECFFKSNSVDNIINQLSELNHD